MAEYIIRLCGSTKTMGPYRVDQLRNLVEIGQVSCETEYFDDGINSWVAIGGNQALNELLFKKERMLSLKEAAVWVTHLGGVVDGGGGVAMSTLMETAYPEGGARGHSQATPCRLAPILGMLMILAGLSVVFPFRSELMGILDSGVYGRLMFKPYMYVALIDWVLAYFLIAQGHILLPCVRIRVFLGLGYFGYTYWAMGYDLLMYAAMLAYFMHFLVTLNPKRGMLNIFALGATVGYMLMLLGSFLL